MGQNGIRIKMVKSITFTLLGEFTDLNNYIKAERSYRLKGAKIKSTNTDHAAIQMDAVIKRQFNDIKYPVLINCKWFVKNLRKDPDNIAFAKKYILDAMVIKGILEGDTMRHIKGFKDGFEVDRRNPRVDVTVSWFDGFDLLRN